MSAVQSAAAESVKHVRTAVLVEWRGILLSARKDQFIFLVVEEVPTIFHQNKKRARTDGKVLPSSSTPKFEYVNRMVRVLKPHLGSPQCT